jgi:hypothetical protein
MRTLLYIHTPAGCHNSFRLQEVWNETEQSKLKTRTGFICIGQWLINLLEMYRDTECNDSLIVCYWQTCYRYANISFNPTNWNNCLFVKPWKGSWNMLPVCYVYLDAEIWGCHVTVVSVCKSSVRVKCEIGIFIDCMRLLMINYWPIVALICRTGIMGLG